MSEQLPEELLTMRTSIDNLDACLIHLMAERFKITKRIGKLKAEHNMPAGDSAREAEQVTRLRELAVESHLDPEFAEKLLNFIVSEVVRHHLEIAEKKD
uniref:chorismate mutase n=1 Tax=Vaginimicrobium propionicum TaxID=1871034 RepID=UPI0009703939|nr:chorismate mutase [Vaginimicrobium propionicum]